MVPAQAETQPTIQSTMTTESLPASQGTVIDSRDPQQPSRSTSTRHSKKLSLNFPILVPSQSQSQTHLFNSGRRSLESSGTLTPITSPRLNPASANTVTSPTVATAAASVGSVDFLTLLASQERKVLELREELQRAENELSRLKKSWAAAEAGRKRQETRTQSTRLKRLSSGGPTNNIPQTDGAVDVDDERDKSLQRRRTMIAKAYGNTGVPPQASSPGTQGHRVRRTGQRVFSSSRHARTLSLLATPTTSSRSSTSPARSSVDATSSTSKGMRDERDVDDANQTPRPSIPRTSTLPDFGENTGMNGFGKTYKDLANRSSLPPVPQSAEKFVKQGQKVAEGLREGLWTFFEDMRQATIGEEGVSGQQRPVNANPKPKLRQAGRSNGPSRSRKVSKNIVEGKARPAETSFWNEFGIDTPGKLDDPFSSSDNGAPVQQPAETPDLLEDIEGDDEWEPWESPVTKQDGFVRTGSERPSTPKKRESSDRTGDSPSTPKAGQALQWPELKRSTPSKFTRKMSELMEEMERESEDQNDSGSVDSAHERDSDTVALPVTDVLARAYT